MSVAPLLSLEAVGRRYGGLAAVSNLTFDIVQGEICGLIGPNGAGKSTTFTLIAGAVLPSTGHLRFVGRDITGTDSHAVARLGIARMFQAVHLFESMTVAGNLLVGADRHDRLGVVSSALRLPAHRRRERVARARAKSAAAMLGLEPLLAQPVAGLPVGQQRLVAVARALASQPRLLLLDEPAAGLSPVEIDALAKAVRQARETGVTMLVVEHNVDFVLGLCDHIVVMHDGRKICDGSPSEIRASAAVREAYLGV